MPRIWPGCCITAVRVPSASQEAARDLVRARDDCRGDLMTARHRVSKLLLRQGIVYSGGKAWTRDHERWLRAQRFDNPALQLSYEAAFDAMLACLDRRSRLDEAITKLAAGSEFTPVVHRLGCIRGVATLTAFGLAVEIGDWHRLTGRTIGAYVGLVPSEYSSGDSRTQGGVTKTGNGHVRRLLVEAAWHHRSHYRPGAELRRRWDLASPSARARGQAANRRLHTRWVGFDARHKRSVVANVAVARELAGWCWSLAIMPD
jgi:transposase